LEINKTVIVVSRWFLYYLTYIDDARSKTNQFFSMYLFLFLTLCMFRAHRAHHQERQIVSIHPMVAVILCRWLCCVQVRSLVYWVRKHSINVQWTENCSLVKTGHM